MPTKETVRNRTQNEHPLHPFDFHEIPLGRRCGIPDFGIEPWKWSKLEPDLVMRAIHVHSKKLPKDLVPRLDPREDLFLRSDR
jgi:hypothetical protein